MDYVSNEHPTGGFFGGGYEGAFQAIRLDSDKNQATGSPLGIITKTRANRSQSDFQKDDIYRVLSRAQKLILQETARTILRQMIMRKTNSHPDGYKTFVHRVNYCLCRRIDNKKGVGVRINENRGTAYYDNLQRCGSVWTCAPCSGEITEVRKIELKQGIDNWRSKGGFVYLVSLTNRHHFGDNLTDLLNGQRKALQNLWRQRAVKEMMKTLGCVGRITATEVTWNWDNGWHPHFHILMFFDHEINTQGLQSFLALHWVDACTKAKLKAPSLEHGVDVQKGDKAQDYVAKWGLEHEMTKGHLKKGKKDGLTPFDLLRQSEDNPHYQALFRQFANVFKGKQQLHWSNGLKALLNISNRTDEELAEETEKESIEIQEVATQIWRLVLRYKFRGEYLRACELDYLDGGSRVYDLVMYYAVIEQERLNALDSA